MLTVYTLFLIYVEFIHFQRCCGVGILYPPHINHAPLVHKVNIALSTSNKNNYKQLG